MIEVNAMLSRLAIACALIMGAHAALAYPEDHKHSEDAQVQNFLGKWTRPKGQFSITHRVSSCCWSSGANQDCSPVAQTRVVNGVIEVRPDLTDYSGTVDYNAWYKVDTGVNEVDQPDPRESPDGRSYVCVAANEVVCFVPGAGL
jgi:hypothetical protein